MPSLFYKASYERRFPLSFLFFEDLSISTGKLGEMPEYTDVQKTVKQCLQRAVPDKKITDEDVEYVSDRLEKMSDEGPAEEEDKGDGKKGFATSFSTWMAGLEPHNMCLVIAGMDYKLAKSLYCDTDREDVLLIATQWVHAEWERIKVGYESVVYGFGGGYKDEAVGEVVDSNTDDHTQGTKIDPRALAGAGF